MNRSAIFWCTAIILLLIGCSPSQTVDKFIPQESQFARRFIDNLREGKLEETKKYLSPDLLTPDVDSKLRQLALKFPGGELVGVQIVGSNTFPSPMQWKADLSFQYHFSEGWALVNMVLRKENDALIVTGVHINRIPTSLEEMNAFTFKGKSPVHYIFLSIAVFITALMLYAFILCLRKPGLKRKWLWIIVVLIGFVGFSLNWTTGQLSIKPISLHLPVVKALKPGPYAPWEITLSLPIGAVIFLSGAISRRPCTKKISYLFKRIMNRGQFDD